MEIPAELLSADLTALLGCVLHAELLVTADWGLLSECTRVC